MKNTLCLILIIVFAKCKIDNSSKASADSTLKFERSIEAITSLNDTLFSSYPSENSNAVQNYKSAKAAFESNPDDEDKIIWYGRRTAYLGYYRKAIDIYADGLSKHPESARLLRHRGHRYISTRQYDKAIQDFEKASELIQSTPNQIEQDGIPNAQNKPISSLHGNIYYHLALAYYLKSDFKNAARVYRKRISTHQNDDNIVSAAHWHYMTLRRRGEEGLADEVLGEIEMDMEVIENMHYHNICLFYKGLIPEEDLPLVDSNGKVNEVFLYGLGNWYLYEKSDTAKATSFFMRLLDSGNKASFAYLAAETDMVLFKD